MALSTKPGVPKKLGRRKQLLAVLEITESGLLIPFHVHLHEQATEGAHSLIELQQYPSRSQQEALEI